MKVESGRWIVQLRTTTKHGLIIVYWQKMPSTGVRILTLTSSEKRGRGINPIINYVVIIYTMAFNLRVQLLVFKQALKMNFRKRNFLGYVDYNQLQEKTEAYRCSVIWGKKMGKRSLVIVK
jgi:hypothetical protein